MNRTTQHRSTKQDEFGRSYLPNRIEAAADRAMQSVLDSDACHSEALLIDALIASTRSPR